MPRCSLLLASGRTRLGPGPVPLGVLACMNLCKTCSVLVRITIALDRTRKGRGLLEA